MRLKVCQPEVITMAGPITDMSCRGNLLNCNHHGGQHNCDWPKKNWSKGPEQGLKVHILQPADRETDLP